jgi:beta-glucosidase
MIMKNVRVIFFILSLFTIIISYAQTHNEQDKFSPPVDINRAEQRADTLLTKLSLDEKISLTGGYQSFFIRGFPEHQIPYIFMSDATQGVRLREKTPENLVKRMNKSTAFPCPILLASTWNPELASEYARCVGEECRAAGVHILLGPGLNLYRNSQCGRNFEYFGEDPFLIARMIEQYITGIQKTGTIATLKHFICNNTDFYRRRSNSIVDQRVLHEIYLPGFKAGINAGVMAIMTSYNLLNGEWCGQSNYVINQILRKELGHIWLVMTDWSSVWDGEKVIKSGQDLEMPQAFALEDTKELLKQGKVQQKDIDRMVKSILKTCIAAGFYHRPQQKIELLEKFPEHEKIALDVAREGVVLLKNNNHILPVKSDNSPEIIITGKYVKDMAAGGGSAHVEGYNRVTLWKALKDRLGDKIKYKKNPSDKQLKKADVVIISTGTFDREGCDRPFTLPEEENRKIMEIAGKNPNTIVLVNSGAGIKMIDWNDKVAAILYCWYGGQIGNVAVAEIITGITNPCGKLPITIEKRFEDSPAYPYLPEGSKLYSGWAKNEQEYPLYDVHYKEGIFVGYRWYEYKNIEPLYPFGYGLSYTSFVYDSLQIIPKSYKVNEEYTVSFMLKNCGNRDGAEVAQLYIQDIESSFPRPLKELKGFKKVFLKTGESRRIEIHLNKEDFSFWNPRIKEWDIEPGKFNIIIGSSSKDIKLSGMLELL